MLFNFVFLWYLLDFWYRILVDEIQICVLYNKARSFLLFTIRMFRVLNSDYQSFIVSRIEEN